MRIVSSEMQMAAASQSVKKEREIERLEYWEGNNRVIDKKDPNKSDAAQVDLSDKAKDLVDKKEAAGGKDGVLFDKNKGNNKYNVTTEEKSAADKIREQAWEIHVRTKEEMTIKLLESFSSMIFGKKFNFKIPTNGLRDKLLGANSHQLKMPPGLISGGNSKGDKNANANAVASENWGVSYERLYERYESEQMSFSAQGVVKTADGKEISLSLNLNMSRSLYERSYTAITAGQGGQLLDPLVVNYAGPAADLTDTKYSFDIDSDGKEDQISFVGRGSGFLALDKNGDGKINDGSELFGTQSGDGFKDLAAYDKDGNGWIDEGDEIFNKLRIWTKDEKGNDKLLSLGEAGIGAIYLGNVDSHIDIVGSNGQKNGQVSKTGIFLKESGVAGTIQHVDLSV